MTIQPSIQLSAQPSIQLREVELREVGLRDGLQSIARVLPTALKLEWIADAYAAGLREIEVGSFVPPRLLPQLADTAEVLAYAKTLPGLVASVLVDHPEELPLHLHGGRAHVLEERFGVQIGRASCRERVYSSV